MKFIWYLFKSTFITGSVIIGAIFLASLFFALTCRSGDSGCGIIAIGVPYALFMYQWIVWIAAALWTLFKYIIANRFGNFL